MYRIRLIYDVPGWAYHRRCEAIAKHAPSDFRVDLCGWFGPDRNEWPADRKYDLILQLVPDHANLRKMLDSRGQHDTIVVGGLNVGYGHHVERLRMCRTGADHIVVNNRDCWERLGRPDGMTWISNGVDRDIFHVTQPIAERKPRVLWTGCNFHVVHTTIKGWNEVLVPLAKKFQAANLPHSYRRVNSDLPNQCFSTEQMVEWYNTGTIYLCTSSSEGTPNPALEAAACGCVVVSTRVGNMPELIEPYVNGELVDRDLDAVYEAVLRCQARYVEMAEAMQRRLDQQLWDWKYAAAQYYALFRRLIGRESVAADVPIFDSAAAE